MQPGSICVWSGDTVLVYPGVFSPFLVGIALANRRGVAGPTSPLTLVDGRIGGHPGSGPSSSVLRWIFLRTDETMTCELALSPDDSTYELRISPTTGKGVELFDNAMSAFQRYAKIEKILVNEGWSLQTFERDRRSRRHTQSG